MHQKFAFDTDSNVAANFSVLARNYKSIGRPLVIHVLTSLNFGGVERHMELISEETRNTSMRHSFVAIGNGGAAAQRIMETGAEVTCLDIDARIPSLQSILRLIRLFRGYRPLAVHTHGAEGNFHGLLAAKLAGVPIRIGEEIGMAHHHSKKAAAVFRQVYKSAHRIIGVSKAVSKSLLNASEVPLDKLVTIHNPVRLPSQRLALPSDLAHRLRVCFVGRLEQHKNPLILIGAARELRRMGVPIEFWIIGDGAQRRKLSDEIEKDNLSGEVKLLGFQADPSTFLRQSSVFVQPSLSEGFGIALVEAMGCGVAVAATSVGGAPELIDRGITGWLLDELTPKALAEVLRGAWLLGPDRLFEMGQRARSAVEGRFEPAQYVARLEELYARVAVERGFAIVN